MTPAGLQARIDELVAETNRHCATGLNEARAFVRPSGTEDVVRVYAESATPQATAALAAKVGAAVRELAGGV